MRRLVVVVAVLLISLGAWLAVRALEVDPVVPESPPSTPPRAEVQEPTPARTPPPRAEPPRAPSIAPVAPPDAGEAAPHDVRFRVKRGSLTEPGGRVELSRGRDVVSGNVNMMGEVVLPLRDGTWEVRSPDDAMVKTVEILSSTTSITLELGRWHTVHGRVLDENGNPAVGVEVASFTNHGTSLTFTDGNGGFRARVLGERVSLRAQRGADFSNVVETALPGPVVRLEFSKTVLLTVAVVSPASRKHVIVRHRQGVVDCEPTPTCRLRVPVGEFNVVAIGDLLGRTAIAQLDDVAKDEDLTRELKLSPAPPITGVVRDASGKPMEGLSVRAHGLGRTSKELLRPELRGSGDDAVRKTDRDGAFSIQPFRAPDLFFSLTVDGPWQLLHPAIVALGDRPLELTVLPADTVDAGR